MAAFWSTLPRDPAASMFAQANPYMDPLHMRTHGGPNAPWTRYPPSLGLARMRGSGFGSEMWTGGSSAYTTTYPLDPSLAEYSPHAAAFGSPLQPYGYAQVFPRGPRAAVVDPAQVPALRIAARPGTAPARTQNPRKIMSLRRRLDRINKEIQALRSDGRVPRSPADAARRFCTSCGKKLVRSAKFCSQCGDPVRMTADGDLLQDSDEYEEGAPQNREETGPGDHRSNAPRGQSEHGGTEKKRQSKLRITSMAAYSTQQGMARKRGSLEFDDVARPPESKVRQPVGAGSGDHVGESKQRKAHATATPQLNDTPRRKLPLPRRPSGGGVPNASPLPSARQEVSGDRETERPYNGLDASDDEDLSGDSPDEYDQEEDIAGAQVSFQENGPEEMPEERKYESHPIMTPPWSDVREAPVDEIHSPNDSSHQSDGQPVHGIEHQQQIQDQSAVSALQAPEPNAVENVVPKGGSGGEEGVKEGGSGGGGGGGSGGGEFGEIKEMAVGEELGATKPWVGTLKKFKDTGFDGMSPPECASDKPPGTLNLDHVFGYRGHSFQDGKCKVGYTCQGFIVSAAGAMGIVQQMQDGDDQDAKDRTQTHFREHKSEVTCLTMDIKRLHVATGDIKSHIYIWSAEDCSELMKLATKGRHDKGIVALSFSREGDYLVSVGGDDDHRVIVWDWQKADKDPKGCVLAEDKIGRNKIFDTCCNPFNMASVCSFVTVGSKHVKFWDLEPDKGGYKLKKGGGTTDSYAVSVDFIEHSTLDPAPETGDKHKGYALTGAFDSGQVVIWKGDGKKKLGSVMVGKDNITILSSAR